MAPLKVGPGRKRRRRRGGAGAGLCNDPALAMAAPLKLGPGRKRPRGVGGGDGGAAGGRQCDPDAHQKPPSCCDASSSASSASASSSSSSSSQRLMESEWWQELVDRLAPTSKSPGAARHEMDHFRSFFRVSRKTFDYICNLLRQDLVSRPPSGLINIEGRLLTVEKQVAIALRRLASGDPQVSVGEQVGVGQSTVSQVTWRFIESMEERGRHHLEWPNAIELGHIKAEFDRLGMPNCCGAIDATHLVMTLPSVESSADWYDEEQKYSMALQVIVDPYMRFRDILTGWPGSMNEFRLLRNSGFYRLCKREHRLQGPSKILSDGKQVCEFIVGDMAYPLLPWLLTPFHEKEDLAHEANMAYNRSHAATASIAEKALAHLKGAWRILHRVMWRPDKRKLPSIVLVCCLLHNIMIDLGDELLPDVALSEHHDKEYRQQVCNYVDPQGKATRDTLAEYLHEYDQS